VNFRDVLGALRRRWWLVVPALVLALVAGGAGYLRTPPQYTQSESYLLLYPVMTEGGPGNPFLQLGNGVSMAASVLATKVSAGSTAASLAADHPGLTFGVALDVSSGAPIVAVSAQDPDPQVLAATLDRLGEDLVTQLADLQKASGAPEDSWVTISRLTHDPQAQESHSDGVRTGGAAAGGVLVLFALLILLVEWRSALRGRRRRAADAVAENAIGSDGIVPADRQGRPAMPVSGVTRFGDVLSPPVDDRPVVPAGDR
jgi:hypothetical protein